MVQEVNSTNFESILKENEVVVLKLWANWCSPCKAFAPEFESLSEEMNMTEAMFVSADVDENPEISDTYNIRSIPTVLLFVNAEVVKRITGVTNKSDLMDAIRSYC